MYGVASKLDSLTIHGFKSIRTLEELKLGDLNILIGANGAGKSNFVEFFRLLRAMVDERLQAYFIEHGPSDGYFHDGVGETKEISAQLSFGVNGYSFTLKPTAESGIVLAEEKCRFGATSADPYVRSVSSGGPESRLKVRHQERGSTAKRGPMWYVYRSLSDWNVYHFHDTSATALMRRDGGIEQTDRLRPAGENLAPFLLHLRHTSPGVYQTIRTTVQRIAPYFDDFVLGVRESKAEDQVRLTWKQKGKDYIFSPGHLSDGTIRFVCLATALLQPSPPATIVIDEPELGLHPEALAVLAGLFRSASTRTQIIAATQSPVLLSEFEPEHVITVDQVSGASRFSRLDGEALGHWLHDFTLGELWLKGNIRGGVNGA